MFVRVPGASVGGGIPQWNRGYRKTRARMGHISISGPDGSIAAFRDLGATRKIYVHINNSNPVLDETSPERRSVEAAGWEIGYDGMEVNL